MAGAIVKDHPLADMEIYVVWVPMLGSDNQAAANRMTTLFDDPRVVQFWDPSRRVGAAFSKHVFPRWATDGAAALTKDHWAYASLTSRASTPPEQRPLWDMAFFFGKGTTWADTPPRPSYWVKQIGFHGKQTDGTSGTFWRNTFAQAPFASDWFDELSLGIKAVVAEHSANTHRADTADNKDAIEFPGTVGGRVAEAFIIAFNSQRDEAIRDFNLKHRSAKALKDRSMADRLKQYQELYEAWGRLEVINVTATGERSITVSVRATRPNTPMELEFEFETDPPGKLDVIRIRSSRRPFSEAPSSKDGVDPASKPPGNEFKLTSLTKSRRRMYTVG